jgi:hypothetical protein
MNISFFEDKPLVKDLDFKNEFIEKISKWKHNDLINLLIYGANGNGKTTQIYALLATIFDKRVYDLKNATFEEDRKVINYKTSIYHIEIDPLQLGSNDRFFIQTFLKLYVETKNIGLDMPKIILFKNANLLSKHAQMQLRKLIESSFLTAIFIFEVSSISDFAKPLLSRCLMVKIKIPKIEDVKLCIKNFASKKGYDLDENIINDIINDSNKIMLTLNLKKVFGFLRYYLLTKKKFNLLYYDMFYEILNFINAKRISFINLQKIKDSINEMYINLIPMNELLLFLYNEVSNIYKDNNHFQNKLLEITILCDNRLKKGNKECLHLEFYVVSIIDLIQNL